MALLQLHVCSVTRSAAEHNASRLRDLGVPIVPLRASHAGVGAAGGDADSYKGLPTSTLLAVGARVMLKVNLWTVHGLTNGAMGTVVAIVYADDTHPGRAELPQAVVVNFDQYTGPGLRAGTREVAVPVSEFRHDKKAGCTRTQIPLVLGFATTIHKAQGCSIGIGETVTHMTVDLGPTEFAPGLTYVAVSRAKALTNIAFKPAPDKSRFQPSKAPKMLAARLAHDELQRQRAVTTGETYGAIGSEPYGCEFDV